MGSASADNCLSADVSYDIENFAEKGACACYVEGGQKYKQQSDDKDFWNKAEGLLVNLGRSLDYGDNKTNKHTDYQQRSCKLENKYHSVLKDLNYSILGHFAQSLPFIEGYRLKPETREPASSCQPSTSTNIRILNGIATVEGGIIIIPSDISTEETTISITRNGMNSRKPI